MIPQTNYEINRQERVASMHFLKDSLWNLSFPSSTHLCFTDFLFCFVSLLTILLLEKIMKLFILLGGQPSVFLCKQLWCEHSLAWCQTPTHTLLPCNPHHYALCFLHSFFFCEFLLSSAIQSTFSELLPRPLMKDIVPWWFWNPLAWLCPCNFYQDGTLASILQDVIGKKYTLGTRVPEPLWWTCLLWNRLFVVVVVVAPGLTESYSHTGEDRSDVVSQRYPVSSYSWSIIQSLF